MEEDEKPDDTAPDAETETETHEGHEESGEEDCDEAIAGLLDTIAALESRIAELEQRLEQHHAGFKHEPIPEPGQPDEAKPDESHWYFRRRGGRR